MADGKTMFFSSTGYPGMGGYDIFKTTLGDDGTWSKPENIGFPVNTVEDDVFYFPIGNGNKAYYTQRNSTNSDIYVAYLYDETEGDIMVSGIIKDNNYFVQNEIPVRVSGDTIVLNKGKIIKKKTNFIVARDSVVMQYLSRTNDPQSQVYHVPPKSGIQSQDVLSEHMSETYQPFTEKGDYSVIVKSKKDVKMVYNAPNCIFDTKDINSSNTKSKIIYNPILVKIEKGKTIKKKCMAYDNSSALNEFAKSELDLVAECIKTNPDLYVNISTEDYMTAGDELSGKRKNAAIDYLKGKGVPSEKVYVDLSSDNIAKDSVQYTIYDELTLQKAKEDKENRKKVTPPSEQWVTIHYNHYLFGFNKSKLESEKAQGLDSIIIFLKNNPETQIRIIGYADAVGRDEYNKNLSAERALQLKNYFVKQGVSANQLVSDGYGEENPIALNTKKDGSWYKESQKFNRRAEFIVEKQGSVKLKFEVLDIPSQYKDSGYQLNYLK
jgi:outer membrane protein OmpA-like peptidoglycan-associated protein